MPDEWFLYPMKESGAKDVLGWHVNLYDPMLTNTICDRTAYDAYIIHIEGDTMRKRNALWNKTNRGGLTACRSPRHFFQLSGRRKGCLFYEVRVSDFSAPAVVPQRRTTGRCGFTGRHTHKKRWQCKHFLKSRYNLQVAITT